MYKHLGILIMCEREIENSNLSKSNKQKMLLEIIAARHRLLLLQRNSGFEKIKHYVSYKEVCDIHDQIISLCGVDPQGKNTNILNIIDALEASKQTETT